MTTKKNKTPKSRSYHLAIPFERQAHRIPAAHHPTLLTHLRRLRRRPHRTFYLIDELGRTHRL